MTMNTDQARVIDPVLTQTAQGYSHADRVGMTLFPFADISQRGGAVLRFGKESFRKTNARRAPGADTQTIQLGYNGEAFSLMQDALNATVPREHLQDAEAVPGIELGEAALRTVMNNMTLSLECEQAEIATKLESYRDSHRSEMTGSDKWSDPSSDPSKDIDAAKDAVRARIGVEPNRMVISKPVFTALKGHPKIKDQFKYTSSESITVAMLAAYFELEKLAVGKSVVLDSPDDDASFSDVWGNDAVLAYVPTDSRGFEEPSYGYTYRLKGHPFVEQPYWDNSKKSWVYGVTFDRLPIMTGTDAGFLFKSVVG
ncbi:major capsid protein [Aliiroseovarius marinus]|uniref:major capsid protein n=1 Tax=Aliiroseovarius marinus TaxID=2500159 RepID=UPI003D7CA6C7